MGRREKSDSLGGHNGPTQADYVMFLRIIVIIDDVRSGMLDICTCSSLSIHVQAYVFIDDVRSGMLDICTCSSLSIHVQAYVLATPPCIDKTVL